MIYPQSFRSLCKGSIAHWILCDANSTYGMKALSDQHMCICDYAFAQVHFGLYHLPSASLHLSLNHLTSSMGNVPVREFFAYSCCPVKVPESLPSSWSSNASVSFQMLQVIHHRKNTCAHEHMLKTLAVQRIDSQHIVWGQICNVTLCNPRIQGAGRHLLWMPSSRVYIYEL